jgi:hypothetical protein
MGYAGNSEPNYIIPTVIASAEEGKATGAATVNPTGIEDLNFLIGDDALNNKTYQIYYPVRHGLVDNWTHMEKFWQMSIFKYIRCEPEDHYFLLVSFVSHFSSFFIPLPLLIVMIFWFAQSSQLKGPHPLFLSFPFLSFPFLHSSPPFFIPFSLIYF